MITRIALIAVSLFLSSCGALRQVPHIASHHLSHILGENAARINESYTQATNTVILTNILRARDSWPTAYTTVSGVTAEPNIVFKASGTFTPLGLGNAPLPFSGSGATISQDNTADLTYKINPFAEEEGAQNVYVPITANMFRDYWNGNYSNELLVSLMVESYQIGDKVYLNSANSHPTFAVKFLEYIVTGMPFSGSVWDEIVIVTDAPKCTEIANPTSLSLITDRDTKDVRTLAGQVELLKKTFGRNLDFEFDGANFKVNYCDQKQAYRFVEKTSDNTAPNMAGLLLPANTRPLRFSGKKKTGEVKIKLRSIDEAITYVGKWMSTTTDKVGNAGLFLVAPENVPTYLAKGRDDDFAAIARHGDEFYYAASTSSGVSGDKTGDVLSLLTELYVRSQSKGFLEAPEVNNVKLDK